jgi:hypothetical protein
VLLLVALPAVLAKVGEAAGGKRVPKQVHTKGESLFSQQEFRFLGRVALKGRRTNRLKVLKMRRHISPKRRFNFNILQGHSAAGSIRPRIEALTFRLVPVPTTPRRVSLIVPVNCVTQKLSLGTSLQMSSTSCRGHSSVSAPVARRPRGECFSLAPSTHQTTEAPATAQERALSPVQ